MKNKITLKTLLLFFLGGICIPYSGQAQTFCEYIGDGPTQFEYQKITELIPSGNNLAFLGWDGYYFQEMRTMAGKIDQNGNLLWSKSYNLMDSAKHSLYETSAAILETSNGDLVFASNGLNDFGIARVNGTNGTTLFANHYPDFTVTEIFEQEGGNLLIFGHQFGELSVILLNPSLNFISGRHLGLFLYNVRKVIKVANGYYGVGDRYTNPDYHGITFSLDLALNVNWARRVWGGHGHSLTYSIIELPNGGVLTAGHNGNCAPFNDGLLELNHFSAAGTLLNSRFVSDSSECLRAYEMVIRPGGNIIITGEKGSGSSSIYALSLSTAGTYLGARTYGPGEGLAIARSSANVMYLAGLGDYFQLGVGWDQEGYIANIDNQGENCCSMPLYLSLKDTTLSPIVETPISQTAFTLVPDAFDKSEQFGVVTLICPVSGSKTSTIGQDEIAESGNRTTLFPNPANTEINLQIKAEGVVEIQIFDLQGKLVQKSHAKSGFQTLSVAGLENGLYLVQIQSESGIETHKLVIQH